MPRRHSKFGSDAWRLFLFVDNCADVLALKRLGDVSVLESVDDLYLIQGLTVLGQSAMMDI
jgi:hypothetical protein